jgi:hypothetical protein
VIERVRGESASAEPRRRRAGSGELCSSDADAELRKRRFEVQMRGMKGAAEFMVANLRTIPCVNHVV